MELVNKPVYNSRGEIIGNEEDDIRAEQLKQELLNKARARLRCYVTWTKEELAWRTKGDSSDSFGRAMTKRIKCSSTASFLTNWNFGEGKDLCLKLLALLDIEAAEERLDGWCENERLIIKSLLHHFPEGFSWHQLIHSLKVLRLTLVQINKLDHVSSKLTELKALVLISNLIKEIKAALLPQDLRYLELYNNSIQDLNTLAIGLPPNILYFGVGRNALSKSESLEALLNFDHLLYLDISDNDFLQLPECVEYLKQLPALNCLTMNGTPCSMAVSYRKMIQKEMPHLLLFDEVDLKKCPFDLVEQNKPEKGKKKGKDGSAKESKGKGDKKKKGEDEYDLTGELQVHCFKVFCVKEPKKEKNVKNLYFFELECPLIDEGLKEYEKMRVEMELEMGIDDTSENSQDICDRIRAGIDGQDGDGDEGDGKGGKDGKGGTGKDGKGKSGGKDGKRSSKSQRGGKGGKSGADGDDGDGKNKGKGEEDGKGKKYLLPINKTCGNRHKFDNVHIVGWRQMERKCFFFKDEKIGWASGENLKTSKKGDAQGGEDTSLAGGSKKDLGAKGRGGSTDLKDAKGKKDKQDDKEKSQKGKSAKGDSAKSKKDDTAASGGKKNLNPKLAAKLEREMMQNNLLTLIERDKEIVGSTKFKTKEQEWSRIMEFKQPILIKTEDLMALRDTFRTVLMLRLIHTKVKFSKADKEKKKTKKGKEPEQKKDDDNVLLREKLAVIPIPLESIKWNQKFLSYTWDMSKPCLAEKHPNVKDIKYSKAKGKGAKGKEETQKSKGTAKVPPPPEPTILTVHLGVGVKRDTFT